MKILCMSGGADKGAFQAGVISWLMAQGCSWDGFAGISVGALNAAFLGQFDSAHGGIRLEALWREVSQGNVHKRHFPFGYIHGLWTPNLRDSSPLEEFISDHYSPDRLQLPVVVGAVSLQDNRYRTFHQPSIKEVVASAAFPGFFAPVEIDGQLYADGGIREVTPLKDAIEMGATSIDVILTWPDKGNDVGKKPKNVLDVLLGALSGMMEEVMENDLKICRLTNHLVVNGNSDKKHIPIRIFRPLEALPGTGFDFDGPTMQKMIESGYAAAEAVVG